MWDVRCTVCAQHGTRRIVSEGGKGEGGEREGKEREEREGREERESWSNCTILAIPKPQDLIPHRNPHISFGIRRRHRLLKNRRIQESGGFLSFLYMSEHGCTQRFRLRSQS